MTAQDRSTNKSRFQQGDTPQGSDFSDLIDSFVSLTDASPAQTVSSDLRAANFITSGEVSAAVISAPTFNLTNINATNITATRESPSDLHVTTSARMLGTLNVVGTMSAAAAQFDGMVTLISANSTVIVTASTGAGRRIPIQDVSAYAAGFFKIKVAGVTAYVPYWLGT